MRLSRRHFVRIISFSLAAVFVLTGAWLLSRYQTASLRRMLTAHYRRAYFELLSSLESIETSLAKAAVSTSSESLALLSSDIWNSAETAGICLGELPVAFAENSQTAAFLNRVGSYSYSLASRAGEGGTPDDAQRETLASLRQSTREVLRSLSEISAYIYEDDFFSSVSLSEGASEQAYSLSDAITLLENAFPETPTLLYDGPYSEHLVNLRPLINSSAEITPDQAVSSVAALYGIPEDSIHFDGEVEGDIPCYLCTLRNGRSLSLLVTRYGGRLLGLTSSGDIQGTDAVLDPEAAAHAAEAFLEKVGFSSLVASYHHTVGGVCYINFEAEQDGVILYPDLIQIGVSLADGEILSFDARGYLSNHQSRELAPCAVSSEEACALLPETLSKDSVRLALIPTAGKNELFCYEIACSSSEGDRFLFYISCSSGKEEKILLLREDEDGVLAF